MREGGSDYLPDSSRIKNPPKLESIKPRMKHPPGAGWWASSAPIHAPPPAKAGTANPQTPQATALVSPQIWSMVVEKERWIFLYLSDLSGPSPPPFYPPRVHLTPPHTSPFPPPPRGVPQRCDFFKNRG